MKIPGLTTARLHLVLVALCAMTGSMAGLSTALLVLVVLGARLFARGHLESHRMPTTPVGTGLTPMTAPGSRRQPA